MTEGSIEEKKWYDINYDMKKWCMMRMKNDMRNGNMMTVISDYWNDDTEGIYECQRRMMTEMSNDEKHH